MSAPFYTDEGTIVRAGIRSIRGAATADDWDNATEIPTGRCLAIDPLTPEEYTADTGDIDVERYNVQTEPGAALDIRAGDRFKFDGRMFRLAQGGVRPWTNPITGEPDHQEFVIERPKGGPQHG